MPIGKNAVKRVENNGYSKVQSSAPDMENSHVIANVDQQVIETMVKPVEEATVAKTTAKKAPAKKSSTKKPTAKKACGKKSDSKVSLGSDMPYYLL